MMETAELFRSLPAWHAPNRGSVRDRCWIADNRHPFRDECRRLYASLAASFSRQQQLCSEPMLAWHADNKQKLFSEPLLAQRAHAETMKDKDD